MKNKLTFFRIIALAAVIGIAMTITGSLSAEGILKKGLRAVENLTLANGTYTLEPRPQGRLNGVWENVFISRVEVDREYMTFFFENSKTAGDGYGRSATVDWDKNNATLTDLKKPSVYKKNTGRTGQGGGYVVSVVFPRINGKQLKLENRYGLVFAEITLGEPDK